MRYSHVEALMSAACVESSNLCDPIVMKSAYNDEESTHQMPMTCGEHISK